MTLQPLALIGGASSGIGLKLAKLAVKDGYAFMLAGDRPFDEALSASAGTSIETVNAEGVAKLDARDTLAEMNAKEMRPRNGGAQA